MKTEEKWVEEMTQLILEQTKLDEVSARNFAQGCFEAVMHLAKELNES
jgi:hypothetical protein